MVKRLIPVKVTGNTLLVSLGMLAVMHILVLLGFVPSDIVWGGQIGESFANLLALEITAFLVTGIFALVIAAKVGYIHAGRYNRAVGIGAWIIFAFLILNTVGNLASGVSAENFVFAPLTLLLAVCALRVALE